MRYLLDTHVILWWLADPTKLTKKVVDLIADQRNQLFVSSVSIWEMAIKQELGKLHIPMNILSVINEENIQILPLGAEEGLAVIDLPKIHNDPFDRILIAQAKSNDLVFVTKDRIIGEYPIVCLKV